MRARAPVIVLLVAFVAVATLYNAATPIYESPDELQHVAYVAWLAEGRGLPVVEPEQPGPWRQEGTGPPLYYWIEAVLVGNVPHPGAEMLATVNPYANVGDPLRPGNKNVVLHDPQQERWPYGSSAWFVHLARFVSTLMGLGTVAAVYALGRAVLPKRRGIALAMAGLVAFTPQFLFLSASVNNDNLVILVSSWTLVLLATLLRREAQPSAVQLGALGCLLGVAALCKASGLLLWPLAAATLAWLSWRGRRWRWLLTAGAVVFSIAVALCGWWFLRNVLLYGDVTGLSPHLDIMGRRQGLPENAADALAEFRGLRYSSWLLFGWFSILAPQPFYWVMDGLTVLGLAGYALFAVRSRRRQAGQARSAHLMLVAWLGLVAAGVARWTLLTPASQGRLLYPALGALAVLLVVGWAELVPQRLRRPLGVAGAVAWGVWAAVCPTVFLKPAYALPERLGSTDELHTAPSPLGVRYGECCELVGYTWAASGQRTEPGIPQSGKTLNRPIHAGEQVPLTLVWRVLERPGQDYTLFVHASLAGGQVIGQVDTYPGNGMYPTSLWHPGEIIVDRLYVPITETAEGPALVSFQVGLYDPATFDRLPAVGADGGLVERVVAGDAGLVPEEWPVVAADLPADTLFADKIRLTAVSLSQATARAGDTVTVTLQWNAVQRVAEDYTGFVHLAGSGEEAVAQDDHPPLEHRFPTRVWFAGTVVDDQYRLDLPQDLPAGAYELWGGLYVPGSGTRLPAVLRRADANGSLQAGERWKDDLVNLGTLIIENGP